MLKVIDHKKWPILSKLDEIMPRSTATGRFAHNGANDEGDDSDGESEPESASALAADQSSSIPLFPPSVITPFMALSQPGLPVASTSNPSLISEPQALRSKSFPGSAPPPSSSAPIQLESSSVISPTSSSMPHASSSSFRVASAAMVTVPPATSPPPSITPSLSARSASARSLNPSITRSAGKRKQSAVPDLDDHGSLKRRGPRTSASGSKQPGESAILQGFQGSMNHFSDAVHLNNESQPHTILKDATSKLNGAWGVADKFTDGQKIYLLKLFRENQAIASLYASTENTRIRRGYALSELQQYQAQIDSFDRDLEEDNNDDSMYD
jgi:hypothetical protein